MALNSTSEPMLPERSSLSCSAISKTTPEKLQKEIDSVKVDVTAIKVDMTAVKDDVTAMNRKLDQVLRNFGEPVRKTKLFEILLCFLHVII